jgi:hypothetical protein
MDVCAQRIDAADEFTRIADALIAGFNPALKAQTLQRGAKRFLFELSQFDVLKNVGIQTLALFNSQGSVSRIDLNEVGGHESEMVLDEATVSLVFQGVR